MSYIWIDSKTDYKVQNVSVSNPSGHGIQIIRSKNTLIDTCNVSRCLLTGIRDFGDSGTRILNCTITYNGRDSKPYNGDGILVQSQGARIDGNIINYNGNDTTFEHGIYAASVAKDYVISNNKLYGNSASGIKASGGGLVQNNEIKGSVRGIVFADDVPLEVVVENNTISANLYAILVTSNCNLDRYKSDYNKFAKNSRFGYRGQSLTLEQWRKQTGLDKNSSYV